MWVVLIAGSTALRYEVGYVAEVHDRMPVLQPEQFEHWRAGHGRRGAERLLAAPARLEARKLVEG
jgi:putative SOS response-associated peptidase YedK